MATLPRRRKAALTRRDFLGACGCASTLLLPAPLFGASAAPVAQEATKQAAAAIPQFSDYRILPQYRDALSPRRTDPKSPARRWTIIPARSMGVRSKPFSQRGRPSFGRTRMICALSRRFLSPQLTAASPRPQALETIRDDSTLAVRRAKFSSELSLGRDAFLEEFRSSLGLISEFLVAEFKVADLQVASASPLRISTEIRLHAGGHGAAAAPHAENRRVAN